MWVLSFIFAANAAARSKRHSGMRNGQKSAQVRYDASSIKGVEDTSGDSA